MGSIHNMIHAAGRTGLASLFLLGGINKAANFSETATRMSEVGLTPASLLLVATIVLEIMGSLWIIFNLPRAYVAAIALSAFTLATNIIFHRFWELEGQLNTLELSLFFKNIAIAGGLLFVASVIYDDKDSQINAN